MNIKNWSGKKKIAALLTGVLIIVGLVVTIFLVMHRQESRTHAQKATTLTLTPATQKVAPGDDAKLTLTINPGTNQVNFVKFVIKFDPSNFNPALTVLNLEAGTPFKITGGPVYDSTAGTVAYTLDVGSDFTKVVTTTSPIGTILLPAKTSAVSGDYQVTFDQANTEVRSIGPSDTFNENVLLSANPATVTIEAACIPNVSTCSWDAVSGASSYHYKIINTTANTTVSEGDTANTSVTFTSTSGVNYSCSVTASNSCGNTGPSGIGTGSCAAPSSSPTPIPSNSPTPGPSSTPTPTRPISSVTPTPTTPGVTSTPTPTTGIGASPTPSSAPTPTLPPTGNPFVVGGVLGGILILIGGLALLIL